MRAPEPKVRRQCGCGRWFWVKRWRTVTRCPKHRVVKVQPDWRLRKWAA